MCLAESTNSLYNAACRWQHFCVIQLVQCALVIDGSILQQYLIYWWDMVCSVVVLFSSYSVLLLLMDLYYNSI